MREGASIHGIVLAAGRSERMGRCKALLPWDGSSLVVAWVRALRSAGAAPVVVVVGHEETMIRAELADSFPDDPALVVVRNPQPERTSLRESLLLGFDALPSGGATLFTPVDVPVVAPETLAALRRAWEERIAEEAGVEPFAAVPVHASGLGHPVLAGPALVRHLFEGEPGDRVDELFAWATRRLVRVEVDDARVRADVDTPEDYARAVLRWGGGAGLDTLPGLPPLSV